MKKIVILIFIILIGSFIYLKLNNKNDNELMQIIDSENEEITKLITDTKKINYTKENIFSGNFNIKDVSTNDLLSISLNELDKQGKINYCTLPSTFTLEELNNNIKNPNINKKLTKKDINKIMDNNIVYIGENAFYSLSLVEDKYEITTVCGYTDPFNEVINYNFKNATKKNNELIIDIIISFGKINKIIDIDDYSYDYYKDYSYNKYKETLNYNENINTNLYNVYTYTYKLYNDQYYLKSVKRN